MVDVEPMVAVAEVEEVVVHVVIVVVVEETVVVVVVEVVAEQMTFPDIAPFIALRGL